MAAVAVEHDHAEHGHDHHGAKNAAPTVFVRAEGEDDHFVGFAVEVGRRADGWTEILNFPDDDVEVVIRGQYELKLALAASMGAGAKKSAHFHADGTIHEGDD